VDDAGNKAPLLKAREYGTKPKHPYHKEEVYTAETGAGERHGPLTYLGQAYPSKDFRNARMGQVAKTL